MKKYYLIDTAGADTFTALLPVSTREDALVAAISDYLSMTEQERKDCVSFSAVECDNTSALIGGDGFEWSANIIPNGIWEPDLYSVYRDIPAYVDWLAVRYDEEWSHDYGVEENGFSNFLRAVSMCLKEQRHEIAYVSSGDDFVIDTIDIGPFLR